MSLHYRSTPTKAPPTRLREARARLRSRIAVHGRTETVPLDTAAGRVIAEGVTADTSVPHYRRVAMDGYAVRAGDTEGAREGSPTFLEAVDTEVRPGTAVYVDTGSELPSGADSVARVEKVEETDRGIRVLESIPTGKDVAPIGEDVTAGEELYRPGQRLRPPDLGVLRSVGVGEVTVFERPTVGIIPTGEELVEGDPAPGEIVETNGLMVSRYVAGWGGVPTYRDAVTDDPTRLRAAIRRDLSKDFVVTIGGSSVGKRDLLPDVVADLGDLYVHHVAIKPGHPVALGEIDDTPVIMLPGYPVASVLDAVQFLRPAVYWSQGTSPPDPPTITAELAEPISADVGVRRFVRVRVETRGGKRLARPIERSGAGVLTSVTLSDGWVIVEEDRETVPAGETVAVEEWVTS